MKTNEFSLSIAKWIKRVRLEHSHLFRSREDRALSPASPLRTFYAHSGKNELCDVESLR